MVSSVDRALASHSCVSVSIPGVGMWVKYISGVFSSNTNQTFPPKAECVDCEKVPVVCTVWAIFFKFDG